MISPANRTQHLKEYYFSIKQKEIATLKNQGAHVINLGIGSPNIPPSPEIIEAMQSSVKHPDNHGYQPYNGTLQLRQSISEWLTKTYQVHLNPHTEILPLLGSKEGIFHISMAFLNPGDRVLVPELGYPAYTAVSEMVGAKVIYYPLTEDYQPDYSRFTAEMKQAKIMWLNYPHMPTGTPATIKTFEDAIQFGLQNKVLICHDNPYSLVLNNNPLSIFMVEGSKQIALELNSLSKSHSMAGWRIGWVGGNESFLIEILKIKSNIDSGMFKGIQDGAIAALTLGAQWNSNLNQIYLERQKLAIQILDIFGCSYHSNQVGLFVWGKLPENQDSMLFTNDLLINSHLFLTPGSLFGVAGKNYIRISLCAELSDYKLAIQRLS